MTEPAPAATASDHVAAGGEVAPPSLVHLLAERLIDAADRPALVDALASGPPGQSGPIAWTWADLAAAALECRDCLRAAGLEPGDRIVHVGPHTPDWVLVDLACLLGGFTHAAVHADMAPTERVRVTEWLRPAAVVTTGREAPRLRRDGPAGRPSGEITLSAGLSGGAWRCLASDRPRLARIIEACVAATDPDACATILLSSGTTGRPHGVLHSQRALAANAAAVAETFLDDPRDMRLAWLPMSHALARTGDLYTALVRGGCLAVVRDRTRVLEACGRHQPTVILGVPAFFERLEQGVRAGRIADLAAALGGRVRVCVSGAAPLRRRTADFFAARSVPLVEGYGLAEAGPVVAVSNPRIHRPGTVGPPLPGIEVRIDRRLETAGQLLVRTPARALGVIEPDATTTVPPADEWLATGDLAEVDTAGHLRITGRLRDTLVLASGTKLPPADVERALAEDDAVAQVCVVGDGLPWPVALVVPEPGVFRAALRRLGARVTSRRAALRHPRILAWLGRRLARRQAALPRAWQVRRAVLVGRPFDAAHGEATESLKLKRREIERHFRRRVEAAAAAAPPRWACVVPAAVGRSAPQAAPDGGVVPVVWEAADGGFAAAAAGAAGQLPDGVQGIVERALGEIARLRADGTLYDPVVELPAPPPPLDDAPPPRRGRFSRAAEEALGETGLWGLAVPESFRGAGATLGDLARVITTLAADCPTAAGMLAVHSSIGAVSALVGFGTAVQQSRHLPALAAGRPLSIFGGTEPDVGCDLGAVGTTLHRSGSRLMLTGTKMFITGATHGRLVKVLATLDGRPSVALARLPDADTATFRLRHYAIHPLRHAHNAALEFHDFEIAAEDVLAPGADRDGMAIVWHGLNRGRVTLAAQAAGTLRLLLVHAAEHARRRHTWGRPIASRQLVQGRLGRIAASIAACDAVAAWAAAVIDAGASGELEAIVAKTVASGCVRDAALDALGIHGGRAFLAGHPLGDALHDHLAVGVYEGESDLLGLALFRGLSKRHPLARMGATGWRRAAAWLAWHAGRVAAPTRHDRDLLDRRLRGHARAARAGLGVAARRIDAAIRRHGRALPDHQLEIGEIAAAIRDLVSVLATAWHADATGCEHRAESADVWCRLALARVAGRRPGRADLAAVAALGSRAATAPEP
jgi:long-subunit acyl-CoA synthetase (AMP-forming)/alkylation response protein AidB-like acyl-CoA dehydrogenase